MTRTRALLCLLAVCAVVVVMAVPFRARRPQGAQGYVGEPNRGGATSPGDGKGVQLRAGVPVFLGMKGERRGPFSPEIVKGMIAAGEVVITRDLIWQEGMEAWVPLSEVLDLATGEFRWQAGERPQDVEAHFVRGNALAKAGKHAEACKEYAKAVEINPRFAQAYFNWGVALGELGYVEDACERYAKAAEIDPRCAGAHLNWGNTLFMLGKYGEACEKHAKALEVDPRQAKAYLGWGMALGGLGRWAEAGEKYAKAVELDAGNAWAYYGWGVALARIGRRAEAEEKLNKAHELNPELKPLIEGIRREVLGKE